MAQRLATEYVNTTLQMTEFQMNQFLLTADTCYISHRVKVLGGGEQEIVLEENGGSDSPQCGTPGASLYLLVFLPGGEPPSE